jgi:hypothetical protein
MMQIIHEGLKIHTKCISQWQVITVNYVKIMRVDGLIWSKGKILVPELVVKHNIIGGILISFHAMMFISVKSAHHTCPNSCCYSAW